MLLVGNVSQPNRAVNQEFTLACASCTYQRVMRPLTDDETRKVFEKLAL
jgi:hypothetical protein